MNTKQIEALKLALEALNTPKPEDSYPPLWRAYKATIDKAITAIREALAEQPAQQQEPVAYASDVEFDDETEIIPAEQKGKLGTAGLRIPLYIDPPASKPWVGLTEIEALGAYEAEQQGRWGDHVRGLLAVEAKLREKNA